MWGGAGVPTQAHFIFMCQCNQHQPKKNSVHPLEQYLTHLAAIRNTGAGTAETSYYPPLIELLNAVGHTLKPKVRALNSLVKTGVRILDGDRLPRP